MKSKHIDVELTRDDLIKAFNAADYRFHMNLAAKRERREYEDSMKVGYNGMLVEYAVEKYYKIIHNSAMMDEQDFRQWNYKLRRPDVGPFECKSSTYWKAGLKLGMKYFKQDKKHYANHIAILGIIKRAPSWDRIGKRPKDYIGLVRLAGWAFIRDLDGKNYDAKYDQYVLPQPDLRDMAKLERFKFDKFVHWKYKDSAWMPKVQDWKAWKE